LRALRAVVLGEEEVGDVEEEADVRLVGAAFVEIDARPFVGARVVQPLDRCARVGRRRQGDGVIRRRGG